MARLTIPDEPTSASFDVTTAEDTFPFDFAIFEKADLVVQVDGVSLDQADFTLTGTLLEGGGYQGGTVVLNDAVEDVAVFIYRDVTPARAENFGAVTSVPVRTVDQALNRQMAVSQDLRRDQSAVLAALPILETLPENIASEEFVDALVSPLADEVDGKAPLSLAGTTVFNAAAPTIIRDARAKFRDGPTAFDFVPVANHSAIKAKTSSYDASGDIQLGLDTEGQLRLNPGLFICEANGITATRNGQSIVGTGRQNTELRAVNLGAKDLINADTKDDFLLQNILLLGIGSTSDGTTAIRLRNGHTDSILSVRVAGTFTTQVALDGGPFQFQYLMHDYSLEANCVESITVGKSGPVVQELFLGDGLAVGGSDSAVSLYHASGLYPGNVSLLGGYRNLVARPGLNQVVRYVRGGQFICDSTAAEACLIAPQTGGIVESWDTKIWASSSYTEAGFVATATEGGGLIDNMKLDLTALNNEKAGYVLDLGTRWNLDVQCGRNSRAGANAYPNASIGDGVIAVTATGTGADVGSSTFTELASHAIQIADGAADVTLMGYAMDGCLTGPIIDLGARTTIVGCKGCVTQARGTSVIPNGQTSVSVPIPIDVPLMREQVRVQPYGPTPLWCSAVSGQNATITASGPVVGDTFFEVHVDQSFKA